MRHQLFVPIAALGLAALVTPAPAAAERIHLKRIVRQQFRLLKRADAHAVTLARQAYTNMPRPRQADPIPQAGPIGPSIPAGAPAASLNAANRQLQAAMNSNIQHTAINRQKTYNSVDATREAIVHGCQTTFTSNQRVMVCP